MRVLFAKGGLIGIFCEEPTHFGRGRETGLVDLPIQRSATTDLPIGQSSSIRGVLRSFLELSGEESLARDIFGSEPTKTPTKVGYIDLSDAKLLVMPIRSIAGLFCWLTCSTCLSELNRALKRLQEVTGKSPSNFGLPEGLHKDLEVVVSETVPQDGALMPKESENVIDGKLVLLDGEMELKAEVREKVSSLAKSLSSLIAPSEDYLKNIFKRRFAVVKDDIFKLATKRGLEVATRISIEYDTKTVRRGGLWSEEYLPAFSFLFSEVYFHTRVPTEKSEGKIEDFLNFMERINGKRIFIGGKEGIGKGLVYLKAYYEKGSYH